MHRILILDDEPFVLSALRRSLSNWRSDGTRATYCLETFDQPERAITRLQEMAFDVVLSDYNMPGMNGVEFLSEVRRLQPDAIRIILSGFADLNAMISAINEAEIFRFISKPWGDYELKAVLEHAVQYRELQVENKKLADIIRVERGMLSRQEAELKRLEQECPGITQVKWGSHGEVLFEDMTAAELLEVEELFRPSGVKLFK